MVDGSDGLVSSCWICTQQSTTVNGKTVSPLHFFLLCPSNSLFFFYFLSLISLLHCPTVFCPSTLPLCFHLQSNSLLPESLRNSDKRRNGPDFSNETKKRKVDDKDSSHYVRIGAAVCGNTKMLRVIFNLLLNHIHWLIPCYRQFCS